MKFTVEVDDQKVGFFLELLEGFKDFVKVERTATPAPVHPLDFVGIFNDLDREVFEDLTVNLHEKRYAASEGNL